MAKKLGLSANASQFARVKFVDLKCEGKDLGVIFIVIDNRNTSYRDRGYLRGEVIYRGCVILLDGPSMQIFIRPKTPKYSLYFILFLQIELKLRKPQGPS